MPWRPCTLHHELGIPAPEALRIEREAAATTGA